MSLEEIAEIGIEALREAKKIHDELGEKGLKEMPSPNRFGEIALAADILAEEAVLTVLRGNEERAPFPIRVVSEEHGTQDLVEYPLYLGILDGIDGTSEYVKGRGRLRYATMLGIAEEIDPRYQDYLFAGIMEHASNRLWIATKRNGAWVIEPNGSRTPIRTSSREVFDNQTRVYDGSGYNDVSRQTFARAVSNNPTRLPLSAAISYVDIASGQAEIEVEVTRKGNLEQMIAYGLIREAGGVMTTLDGEDLGHRPYLLFGQDRHIPIVTAANRRLAQSFLDFLRTH